jgi:hypothetical protein
MKQHIFLTVLALAIFLSAVKAQNIEKKTVHAGESLSALFTYRFPTFTDANVQLKSGGAGTSKMNFNLLICEMQFIDPHGDTLSIAKPEDIDSIALGGSLFFYKDGYKEVVGATDSVKLVIARKVSYEPIQIGAMGLRTRSGVGIDSYASLLANSAERQLVVNVDVDIVMETTYFLASSNGVMLKASKTAFLTLFPKNTDAIQAYLKANKTSFNKEKDIKKLLDFCVALH